MTLIGPFTLHGTDAQIEILAPMAETMAATLALPDGSYRVEPANVYVRERAKMPWARKPGTNGTNDRGVRARGFWTGDDQLLADDLFPTPDLARKTFAHETVHQLDDQWLLRSNRKSIKPLFDPAPAGWPAEPFAVYGSAAIFGFTKPPYTTFYTANVIPIADWPLLREFALRDDHPIVVPPDPPPPDPNLARIAELEALLTVLRDGNAEVAAQNLTLANKANSGIGGGGG